MRYRDKIYVSRVEYNSIENVLNMCADVRNEMEEFHIEYPIEISNSIFVIENKLGFLFFNDYIEVVE